MSAIQAKNEIYEPKKLDAIYQNLVSNQQNGRIQDYEIRVDDFPVVGKNNDPSRFMSYADFITADTKCITVFLYRSNGQSDKYFFHLKPENFQKAEQLGSISNQTKILDEGEIKDRIMKDLKVEELLKENAELKEEVKEYEVIVANMEQEIVNIRSGRDKDVLGWVSLIGKGLIGNVTDKISNENVSGLNNDTSGEEKSSFKRKDVEDVESENTNGLSDKERGYLRFIDDVRNRIGDIELANVMHLLDLVAAYPPAVHYAIKMVTTYIKQQTKEEPNEKV